MVRLVRLVLMAVSIPEGPIKRRDYRDHRHCRRDVSIPEGPIKRGALDSQAISLPWFQFPKDQLKEDIPTHVPDTRSRFNSRRTN